MNTKSDAHELLQDWLSDSGVAVLARRADGSFEIVGRAPEFFVDMARAEGLEPEAAASDPRRWSPFLENFLIDAETSWRRGERGRLLSGPWCETTRAHRDWYLEAAAVTLRDGRALLVIEHLKEEYGERLAALQKVRSLGLEYDRLQREVQDKEVLLHCIVHDLKAPLTTMYGSLSLVRSGKLAPERAAELVQLGMDEAKRQESMIKQILEVFRSEIDALHTFESRRGSAPDVRHCLRVTTRAMLASFERRGVQLESSASVLASDALEVRGREDRLQRVFVNLLDNALRHSPSGTTVSIELVEEPEFVRVHIDDRGSGVDPSVAPVLFQRFISARSRVGAAGLGLYYCRRTVEAWGGSIGFEPRDDRGSRFWVRLPRAE